MVARDRRRRDLQTSSTAVRALAAEGCDCPAELTGAAAVHSLAHEIGHFLLGHKPVPLPKSPSGPDPEAYEYLSANFLGGSLLGRTRSQEVPLDPEYVQIEDQAEQFAFRLRRVAAHPARETRHRGDPLVDRVHHSL